MNLLEKKLENLPSEVFILEFFKKERLQTCFENLC